MLVYRKTLDCLWVCSWNCGFEDHNVRKVIEHEIREHLKIENYSRKSVDIREKYYLEKAIEHENKREH
jgi:hypothetical protein